MASRRKRGKPPKRTMPEPIDAEPGDIMGAVVSTPPKREEWHYLTGGNASKQP